MASKDTTPRRSGPSDPAGAPSADQGPNPDAFEPQYKRLEEIVARLEQGDLTLEESLSLYEEGMKLARSCQELLQRAELRITRLQESFADGLGGIREEAPEYEPDAEEEGLPLE
jgi:exodeoxyribonuclease VII small subunit